VCPPRTKNKRHPHSYTHLHNVLLVVSVRKDARAPIVHALGRRLDAALSRLVGADGHQAAVAQQQDGVRLAHRGGLDLVIFAFAVLLVVVSHRFQQFRRVHVGGQGRPQLLGFVAPPAVGLAGSGHGNRVAGVSGRVDTLNLDGRRQNDGWDRQAVRVVETKLFGATDNGGVERARLDQDARCDFGLLLFRLGNLLGQRVDAGGRGGRRGGDTVTALLFAVAALSRAFVVVVVLRVGDTFFLHEIGPRRRDGRGSGCRRTTIVSITLATAQTPTAARHHGLHGGHGQHGTGALREVARQAIQIAGGAKAGSNHGIRRTGRVRGTATAAKRRRAAAAVGLGGGGGFVRRGVHGRHSKKEQGTSSTRGE